MNKLSIIKKLTATSVIVAMLSGCAMSQSNSQGGQNEGMNNTQKGALLGGLLGAVIGGTTANKGGKRAVLGGIIGAAIGAGVGYSMDQQAKEIAQELETDVDNDPLSVANPDKDLIVSNTDKYVKIMLRDSMVFETNKATPTFEASQKIAKISDVLKNYPNTIVQVVGFTDSRGSFAYNQKLSDQRAQNVGNSIHNSGIPNQIFSKGCSYNKPIAPNTTKENMALNRRVEIYLYPDQNALIDACTQH